MMALSHHELTIGKALEALAASGQPFIPLFEHGSLVIEVYKPDRVDLQTPHTRDEIYVVIAGTGWFVNGDVRHLFEPGHMLFVPAGITHRFEEFSHDFSTWVLFYGPEGGEAST